MFNVCHLISELLVSQTSSRWNFQLGTTESRFSDFSDKAVVVWTEFSTEYRDKVRMTEWKEWGSLFYTP